jgi:hypothetical protein
VVEAARPDDNGACANPIGDLEQKCRDLTDAQSEASTHSTLATVGFIAGGVGVVTFLGTMFFWPEADTQVGGLPLDGGGFLSVSGSF